MTVQQQQALAAADAAQVLVTTANAHWTTARADHQKSEAALALAAAGLEDAHVKASEALKAAVTAISPTQSQNARR